MKIKSPFPPSVHRFVKKAIALMRKHPDKYDQVSPFLPILSREFGPEHPGNPCGCIGGFIMAAAGHDAESRISRLVFARDVSNALSIFEESVEKFYYSSGWPDEFYAELHAAKTDKQRVEAAAKRMEHWLETGE